MDFSVTGAVMLGYLGTRLIAPLFVRNAKVLTGTGPDEKRAITKRCWAQNQNAKMPEINFLFGVTSMQHLASSS